MKRLTMVLLAAALVSAPARAQVVTGRAVREDGRTPVGGAVISLVHDGERIRPMLSDPEGYFLFRNAPTGNWIVRADAAGFGINFSEAFRMGPRDSVNVTVRLTPFVQQLASVTSGATTQCNSDPGGADRTAIVWSAIRSTLEASLATERERLTPLEIAVVDHELDIAQVRQKSTPWKKARSWSGVGFRAYSPAVLERQGFVKVFADSLAGARADRGVTVEKPQAQSAGGLSTMISVERELEEREYYLPDADVLTSREFLGSHCFRVVERPGTRGEGRTLGLAFTPNANRLIGEIEGTLWLDPVTAALKQLAVSFLIPGRPRTLPSAHAVLDFAQLPTGRWIVSHWALSMPQERSQRNSMDNGYEQKLAGWAEREGTVRVLPTAEASSIAPGAVVRGRILDGTTGRPLTDAVFTLDHVGTELVDSSGRFLFQVSNPLAIPLPTKLTMMSERAVTLGVAVPARDITFNPGDTVEVNIAIPSAARMRQALCGGVADSLMQAAKGAVLGEGTVIGRVTSNAEAVEEALVIANWYIDNAGRPSTTPSTVIARRATRTSAGGRYVACALPENVPVTLHAERAEAKSAAVTVTAAPNSLAEAFLTLAPAPAPAKKAARP